MLKNLAASFFFLPHLMFLISSEASKLILSSDYLVSYLVFHNIMRELVKTDFFFPMANVVNHLFTFDLSPLIYLTTPEEIPNPSAASTVLLH